MFQSVSVISPYNPVFQNTRNGAWYFHLFQSLVSVCFETFRNSWNVQTSLIFITFQSVSKQVKQLNLLDLVNFQRFIFLCSLCVSVFHWNKMHALGLCGGFVQAVLSDLKVDILQLFHGNNFCTICPDLSVRNFIIIVILYFIGFKHSWCYHTQNWQGLGTVQIPAAAGLFLWHQCYTLGDRHRTQSWFLKSCFKSKDTGGFLHFSQVLFLNMYDMTALAGSFCQNKVRQPPRLSGWEH